MTAVQTGLLLNRYKKPILYTIVIVILAIVLMIALLMESGVENNVPDYMGSIEGTANVPEHIEKWRPLLEEYTKKYGVEEYTEFLLALMYQEVGGSTTLDIMQSSESLGLAPNAIQDPVKSVDAGVSYFKQMLHLGEKEGVDFYTIVQSYNFGGGYISFVKENGGTHSLELAAQFSSMYARKLGWDRYGDQNYVQRVMKNLSGGMVMTERKGEWALPVQNLTITSPFGFRSDPETGERKLHQGIDFSCAANESILAVKAGLIVTAEYNPYGYGNLVVIQHDEQEFSAYAHLISYQVHPGQEVERGERIGGCGNTGRSFGNHLHFEHRVSNHTSDGLRRFVDPAIILGL